MYKVLVAACIISMAAGQYYSGYGHGQGLLQNHGNIGYRAPVIVQHQPQYTGHYDNRQDYYAAPHYSYEYSVADSHTGDIKSQHESREGDVVRGAYSLHESDGTIRTVEYSADAHNGFNAVVHRQGHAAHAVPVHH
ncbi:PREDICTED: cuticle protein 7-like [Papilio xuthus]|uniref:Cuticle protein 7-like n=1 Tax=Papilio xuthus TaxID=66420 RepID=I4DKM3_PAPXU|nr:cuticle protein 7-like precursor [Papilio xuthus]BAM18463.1 cuticular protein PxutCPR107 [Papilio xuthus]